MTASVHNINEAKKGPAKKPAGIDWSEPFVTKQQLANHLGFSTAWLDRQVKEGLPAYRVGSRLRFQRSTAVRWLLEQGGTDGNP